MNFKKIIALVLVFSMCLSMVPSYAFAGDEEWVDNEYDYQQDDGVAYEGGDGDSDDDNDVYVDGDDPYTDVDDYVEEHSYAYWAAKEPGCEEAGNREFWYCEDCGAVFTLDEFGNYVETTQEELTIPATGHSFVGGVCACGEVDPNYVEDTDGDVYSEGETKL